MAKVQNEIMGKEIGYTPEDKKEIQKQFRFFFGSKLWKGSIFELYEDFLNLRDVRGKVVPYVKNRFDVYDLAALAYLYKRIKETEEVREASHVVIDEAQDFGMMAYAVLKYCMRAGCTFTIMGDVSQNISFGYGLNDWEELKEHFLTGTYDSFNLLKKSYRNTIEISDFATNLLKHGTFPVYPVEPILRHGNSVRIEQCEDDAELEKEVAALIRKWQKKGLETIAVICRDEEEANAVAKRLKKKIKLADSNLETAEFSSGVMVLPVTYTKGLEFDAVVLYDPDAEKYPSDNGHVKLLYVAATRALHELAIFHKGNLSGIIRDPVPEGRQVEMLPEETKQSKKKENKEISKQESTTKSLDDKNVGNTRDLQDSMLRQQVSQLDDEKALETIQKLRTEIGPRKIELSDCQKIKKPQKVEMVRPGGAKTSAKNQELLKKRREEQAKKALGNRKIVLPKTNAAEEEERNLSPYKFGDIPDQSKLRPMGHSRADHAIRWSKKTKAYVDFASAYGTLRLTPITPEIIRVSFQKSQIADFSDCKSIALLPENVTWSFREAKDVFELTTKKLLLRIEKKNGAVQFFTRDGKKLLTENAKEPRLLGQGLKNQSYVFFDWEKNEKLWAKGLLDDDLIKMNLSAKYISYGNRALRLPCLLSERGYGLTFAAKDAVLCCDISVYGTYVMTEEMTQTDYYFMYGGSAGASRELYKILTGKR